MTVAAIVVVAVLAPILLMRLRKRWVARFNRLVVNRISGRFAGRLPGFAMLTHVGRKSGRHYRSPVNAFRQHDGFVIALTYGREAHWVQNVMAAGGCRLQTRGVQYQLCDPVIMHDPARRQFPLAVRIILRILGASDYLRLTAASPAESSRAGGVAGRR